MYNQLKLQNNKLQDLRVRKSSLYDSFAIESALKKEQLVQQILDEVQQLHTAFTSNPRAQSDMLKKNFLSEYPAKAKTIGLANTVEFLLPCIVAAFYSDHLVHPDIYETHVHLLFGQMEAFI